ncbi:NAD-P-binding protein [Mycena polygramma]|nr:NAD-P-binding protein [Mycena polygramma]
MATILEKGTLVLVTGVNGFIASHVADQLLAAGYNVRGTARSAAKFQWLHELFDKKYGAGRFEGVSVPDMVADGAFDEAVKGARGIIHLASIVTFSNKVDEVVPPTVKGTLEVLESAAKEPGVKSVVYTSSSTACLLPQPDKAIVVAEDMWNESAVAEAYSNPSPDPFVVYAASKTEAEKAVWEFVKRTAPQFQVSTVLPDINLGAILTGDSTGSWLPPCISSAMVHRCARLHVAALIDPSCNGKRIFAFAAPYNWNDILAILRKQNPGREFRTRAEVLLMTHYQKGFTGLEETVRENTRAVP